MNRPTFWCKITINFHHVPIPTNASTHYHTFRCIKADRTIETISIYFHPVDIDNTFEWTVLYHIRHTLQSDNRNDNIRSVRQSKFSQSDSMYSNWLRANNGRILCHNHSVVLWKNHCSLDCFCFHPMPYYHNDRGLDNNYRLELGHPDRHNHWQCFQDHTILFLIHKAFFR